MLGSNHGTGGSHDPTRARRDGPTPIATAPDRPDPRVGHVSAKTRRCGQRSHRGDRLVAKSGRGVRQSHPKPIDAASAESVWTQHQIGGQSSQAAHQPDSIVVRFPNPRRRPQNGPHMEFWRARAERPGFRGNLLRCRSDAQARRPYLSGGRASDCRDFSCSSRQAWEERRRSDRLRECKNRLTYAQYNVLIALLVPATEG